MRPPALGAKEAIQRVLDRYGRDYLIRKGEGLPCILCGDDVTCCIGLFCPDEHFAKRLGKKPDDFVIYRLCEDCMESDDFPERIERKLLAKGQVQ